MVRKKLEERKMKGCSGRGRPPGGHRDRGDSQCHTSPGVEQRSAPFRRHLHAVCENAVHAVGHHCVFVLQVFQLVFLSAVLLLQDVDLLPVDPNGDGRRSVQDVLQLQRKNTELLMCFVSTAD